MKMLMMWLVSLNKIVEDLCKMKNKVACEIENCITKVMTRMKLETRQIP